MVDFDELVQRATGHSPYDYQRRLAADGPADVLAVPTGSGKTLAAVLPWLWRRRFHADSGVRAATARWLVFTLPQRVLVEQTRDQIESWLNALDLVDEVGLHVVMGGAGRVEGAWRTQPFRDAILVGTQDMVLSRAINRGYGDSRSLWPVDFGLLNADAHWVFDEVQLMGPGLPTSRQLAGLRQALGTALPCTSTWMSATVPDEVLATVDNPTVDRRVELSTADRTGPLRTRLEASKRVQRVNPDAKRYVGDLADLVVAAHLPGTRTIVVLNAVARATKLWRSVVTAGTDPEVVLVHSRFRPGDRADRVERAVADVDPSGPGRIVVSTQVLEAGVDITSSVLVTEAAPWPSIVQRAGRCNRVGEAPAARLLWCRPPDHRPYEEADVDRAAADLDALEGQIVTPDGLGAHGAKPSEPDHVVLRRRDLLELFDTMPDLAGNDLDVTRFIRDADERSVELAWLDIGAERPKDLRLPGQLHRCPVPLGKELGAFVKDKVAWRIDHLGEKWVRCLAGDLRPGIVLVADRTAGGYDPLTGWDPASRTAVEPVAETDPHGAPGSGRDVPAGVLADVVVGDVAVGDDPATFGQRRWLSLVTHLADVEDEVRALSAALHEADLPAGALEAAAVAGRLHDVGKAHPVFQRSLQATVAEGERVPDATTQPWAKSANSRRLRHERRHFRHEVVSALALLDAGASLLDGVVEADLVVYLVASHHGRVRMGLRPLPDESRPPPGLEGRAVALGVVDSESLGSVAVPGGTMAPSIMDLSLMALGTGADGRPSWAKRALGLRDRTDLGPFRLGFLEALVRVADWRASERRAREDRT